MLRVVDITWIADEWQTEEGWGEDDECAKKSVFCIFRTFVIFAFRSALLLRTLLSIATQRYRLSVPKINSSGDNEVNRNWSTNDRTVFHRWLARVRQLLLGINRVALFCQVKAEGGDIDRVSLSLSPSISLDFLFFYVIVPHLLLVGDTNEISLRLCGTQKRTRRRSRVTRSSSMTTRWRTMASTNHRRPVSSKDIASYSTENISSFCDFSRTIIKRHFSVFFFFGSVSGVERIDADDGAAGEHAGLQEHHRHYDATGRWIDYFPRMIKPRN